MKKISADSEFIKVNGRTVPEREPIRLLWTGSSVEMNVQCSELRVEIAGPYDIHENWIAIEINGEVLSRRMISREREWICIFRNKLSSKPTHVRIIKEVQAMSADEHHCLEIYGVECDGEFLPVSDRELKIEFIGDSINSGEGSIGAKNEEEWISLFFSHVNSYPYMVAKALDADYHVISQSGWGLYVAWDGNTDYAIPLHYENICSLVPGDHFRSLGFSERYDHAGWQPAFICVNLGTNDDGAINNAGFTDKDKISKRAVDFLKTLRRCNPAAHIIWCLGMLGNGTVPLIRAGMDEYIKESGDEHVEFLLLPNTTDETVGARWHPGVKAHAQAAEVLTARIRELM